MTSGENSCGYYQSTYILPSLEIVSFKGFLRKPRNPEGAYTFKIQHRVLDKSGELENWVNDTIKLTSKGDLEKNVCVYLKKYYEEHFD